MKFQAWGLLLSNGLKEKDFEMQSIMLNLNGHSIFSPSSSEMWLNCSGSLIANMQERQKQGETASEFTAQGTVAHEVAEIWLTSGKKPTHLLGEILNRQGYDIEVDAEMLDYVGEYVSWCNDVQGDHYTEVRVDFSHLTPVPNQSGTSDHVCCSTGKLTITDLKYGMGIKVYAENNTQMQIYALGVLNEFDLLYDFQEIEMRICQPRLHHFDSWTISREQLLKFGEYVRERAFAAWQPDAPRKLTEKGCQWCKVRASCPAKAAEIEAMVDEMFADDDVVGVVQRLDNNEYLVEMPKVETLSIEQQEKILNKSKTVRQFLDDIEKNLFDFAAKGGKLQTLKLVAGRTTRKWQNEQETVDYFKSLNIGEDDFAPRSLVTPAAAEKMLKTKGIKQDLSQLIADRKGKPTLAPITDKRPEYVADDDVEWD